MATIYRIRPAPDAPRIALLDAAKGMPEDWVTRRSQPEDVVSASVDRAPRPREFCRLAPGMLVIPADAFEANGCMTSMYYALWWETDRIDLEIAGRYFACIVPRLVLSDAHRSAAPCAFDGLYASIFKLEGRSATELFCVSGVVGGGDEFRHIYEVEHFEGLVFEPICSSGSEAV